VCWKNPHSPGAAPFQLVPAHRHSVTVAALIRLVAVLELELAALYARDNFASRRPKRFGSVTDVNNFSPATALISR
jgi:hypothetical protein